MSARRNFGSHEAWLEGGTLCIRYIGPILVEDMAGIIGFIEETAARQGDLYLLVDSNLAQPPTPKVRRMMAQRGYARVAALARYQRGSVQSSFLTVLIHNAARLIGRSTTKFCVVETEAEARAWLEQQRRQRPH